MRKIPLWLFIFVFTASLAHAQDDATQQQIDKLTGQVQDLIDAQAAQGKRIDALEKQISDMGDKLSQPAANDSASADDLKKLAEQVQELAKKQQDDNDLILKEFEKLAKGGGISPSHKAPPSVSAPTSADNPPAPAGGQQNGYWQPVGSGDTIAAIAKAYRVKGVKVTTSQILAANPGLNPNSLKVGQRIWIPDSAAK
jgi:ABC-type transporter Mla subunit MlaD